MLPTPVFWSREFHDCIVHGVTKRWTRLSDFNTHTHTQTFENLYWIMDICQESVTSTLIKKEKKDIYGDGYVN